MTCRPLVWVLACMCLTLCGVGRGDDPSEFTKGIQRTIERRRGRDQAKVNRALEGFSGAWALSRFATWGPDRSLLATFQGHRGRVNAVAFSPDGSLLASADVVGGIRLWSPATRQPASVLRGDSRRLYSLAFSPDGKTLAAGGVGELTLWDIDEGSPRARLSGHTWRGAGSEILALAFSADGKLLVSGGREGKIILWDVATEKEKLTLAGHRGGVGSVVFAPNGKSLISVGADGYARQWDSVTGRQLDTGRGVVGSVYPVSSVMFDIQRDTVVVAMAIDNLIELKDVNSRKPEALFWGHASGISALAVSPDGKWLASGGLDRTVRLFSLDSGVANKVQYEAWMAAEQQRKKREEKREKEREEKNSDK